MSDFERHITKTSIPVLVDFRDPCCGPRLAMAPQFAAAARALEPRTRLLKLDTEAIPEVAARYDIGYISTLNLFRQEREVAPQSGMLDARSITRWLADHGAAPGN